MIDQNQYIYLQWRLNSVKRAYAAHYANISIRILNVANCIAAGGDPSTDPDVKDDYFYLIGEIGEDVLSEEINRIRLLLEESNNG